jgi:hypothetical protein
MQKFDDFAFRRSFAGIADCLAATITRTAGSRSSLQSMGRAVAASRR